MQFGCQNYSHNLGTTICELHQVYLVLYSFVGQQSVSIWQTDQNVFKRYQWEEFPSDCNKLMPLATTMAISEVGYNIDFLQKMALDPQLMDCIHCRGF